MICSRRRGVQRRSMYLQRAASSLGLVRADPYMNMEDACVCLLPWGSRARETDNSHIVDTKEDGGKGIRGRGKETQLGGLENPARTGGDLREPESRKSETPMQHVHHVRSSM